MRKRKIKKNKPMFKKRRSPARTALNVVLVAVLLLGIAFLGYSVGKPIMEFVQGRENRPARTDTDADIEDPVINNPVTTPPTATEEVTTTPAPEPDPEPQPLLGNKLLFVTIPASGTFDAYLDQRIEYASQNSYYGIVLELIADGGSIYYNTSNERAINAYAVNTASQSGLIDLTSAVQKITDAGLLPYARISMLTDHKLSLVDKSVCYLFEDSISSWYDNSAAAGGKPWMSAFSESAREYISSLVIEMSDAGFAGIIAGEIKFPPFRNSDLNYVGAIVKSPTRYTALTDFSNAVQDALGGAKSYAIEVNAKDMVAGTCEVLRDPSLLHCSTVYVRYDSIEIGTRIVRSDETEVSYLGLSEADKVNVVFKSVSAMLSGGDITIIPAVSDESLIPTLVELGYDERMIIVY